MRIGLFSSEFPSKPPFEIDSQHRWGGLGEVVYHLSLALEDLGHEVYVFSSNVDDYMKHREGQLTVIRFSSTETFWNANISLSQLTSPLNYDLDVVHAHGNLPSGVLSAVAYSKIRKEPVIITIHGDVPKDEGTLPRRILNKSYAPVLKKLLSQANRVTTVSSGYLHRSELLEGVKQCVDTIPNGVHFPERSLDQRTSRTDLGLSDNAFYVLYLGSVIDRKNPGLLVEAVSELADPYPHLRAIVAGEGHARKRLHEEVEKNGLANHFEFPGFVSEERKCFYFSAADLFYSVSSDESFGLAQLEAAACSTPSLVSPLPCFTDRVEHGRNGYVVENDVESVISTLATLLDQPEEIEPVGKRARELAESYRWKEIAREYEKIYNSMASE